MAGKEVTVEVNGGACGFTTRITASPQGRGKLKLSVESECENVSAMADELGELDMRQVLAGFGKGPVAEAAAANLAHGGCPVPSGLIKAAEVALGLNVASDADIHFVE